MSQKPPQGQQCFFSGSYYKIGRHGFVFRHDGTDWVRSNKPAHEVRRQIEIENECKKAKNAKGNPAPRLHL